MQLQSGLPDLTPRPRLPPSRDRASAAATGTSAVWKPRAAALFVCGVFMGAAGKAGTAVGSAVLPAAPAAAGKLLPAVIPSFEPKSGSGSCGHGTAAVSSASLSSAASCRPSSMSLL
jgi:hypothetical protein